MFQEGKAFFDVCPKRLCAAPTIMAHLCGLKTHFRVKSIPFNDAMVYGKYDYVIANVWVGPTRLWAVEWFVQQGRPTRGRLYIRHICGVRM